MRVLGLPAVETRLALSGGGSDHEPITNAVAHVSQDFIGTNDWQRGAKGVLVFNRLSPMGCVIDWMNLTTDKQDL